MGVTDLTPIDVLATVYEELNMLWGIVSITSWGIHTINLCLFTATFLPRQQASRERRYVAMRWMCQVNCNASIWYLFRGAW